MCINWLVHLTMGFPDGLVVKNPPAKQEAQVWSLCGEDPSEKEMAIHFSILAGEILCTEEPGRLQCMGSQRNNLATKYQQHLTMRLVLFSFSCLETGAWKDDVTCSYSQEELELESRQSGHRIHSLLKAWALIPAITGLHIHLHLKICRRVSPVRWWGLTRACIVPYPLKWYRRLTSWKEKKYERDHSFPL